VATEHGITGLYAGGDEFLVGNGMELAVKMFRVTIVNIIQDVYLGLLEGLPFGIQKG